MTLLHRYFWRRLARNILLVSFVFVCLLFTLEFESEFSRSHGDDITILPVFILALLRVPGEYHDLLPLIFLLASLATFFRLVIDYEMIAARSGGQSRYKAAISTAFFAVFCGLGAILVLDPLVSLSGQYYQLLSTRDEAQTNQIFIGSDGQVWLRMIVNDRQAVIRASETDVGLTYRNVTIHSFDPEHRPYLRHDAETAELDENRLRLRNVKTWDVTGHGNVEAGALTRDEVVFETSTDRNEILLLLEPPTHKPVWTLWQLIRNLDKSGFSSIKHQVYLHSKLALPLHLSLMTILGSLVYQHPRRRLQVVVSVLTVLIIGIGSFFLIDIVSTFGEHEVLPVLISTWLMPISLLIFSISFLLLLEGR